MELLHQAYTSLKNGIKIKGIVSDEMMIHLDGTTTAEIFKQIKNLNTQTIPFYLLTALPEINNNFIDGVLSKPLSDLAAMKFLMKCRI